MGTPPLATSQGCLHCVWRSSEGTNPVSPPFLQVRGWRRGDKKTPPPPSTAPDVASAPGGWKLCVRGSSGGTPRCLPPAPVPSLSCPCCTWDELSPFPKSAPLTFAPQFCSKPALIPNQKPQHCPCLSFPTCGLKSGFSSHARVGKAQSRTGIIWSSLNFHQHPNPTGRLGSHSKILGCQGPAERGGLRGEVGEGTLPRYLF